MVRMCFATSNKHKYLEALEIIKTYNIELEQCEVKLEFQGSTLDEIVVKSAMLAYIYLNKPVMVEDAGLFIEALNGFPGPYSNYVYNTLGLNGILKLLEGVNNREACFKSAVAIATGSKIIVSNGEVCGVISSKPRGIHGFGFDPIFIPHGENRTFAEMTIQEKNIYSHRAKSVKKAIEVYIRDSEIR